MFAPSSERWSWFVNLFGRGVGCCLATDLPLGCEAVFERGVRYSFSGLEILHGGEGGDVELGARSSKHILSLCLIHCLSNSLSLYCAKHHSYHHIIFACVEHNSYCHLISICLCCALHLIHISYPYMLGCLGVPHLYLTTRASHSTSTHI